MGTGSVENKYKDESKTMNKITVQQKESSQLWVNTEIKWRNNSTCKCMDWEVKIKVKRYEN